VPSLDSTRIPVSKWEKIRKQRKLVIKKKKMKGEKDRKIKRLFGTGKEEKEIRARIRFLFWGRSSLTQFQFKARIKFSFEPLFNGNCIAREAGSSFHSNLRNCAISRLAHTTHAI
jgi:hypothetical protein